MKSTDANKAWHELGDFTTTQRVLPLSAMAIVIGVLNAFVALALSWTYWWSPWAILFALVGLGVGLVARTDPTTRAVGTAATAMSVAAAVVSVLLLVLV